jgi:glycine/D-amino acid oxidase-like deaminating enzyme
MKVDYIIVGLGLAGLAFAEELIKANKTFLVFEDHSQTSSLVACGVYNPVVLKRFTAVWNGGAQLVTAMELYDALALKLKQRFDDKFGIKRVFKSIEEQNNWFEALDKPLLKPFLNPNIELKKITGIVGDFGFGTVNETGRIDTLKLVNAYRSYLKAQNWIRFEEFEHSEVAFLENAVRYKELFCEHIVFCEGFGIKENPFFKELPLAEVKGELMTIYAPGLNIDFLIKSAVFVIPLGANYYKVGATFNHGDTSAKPTEKGKLELINKLKNVLDIQYEIVEQFAGIRPATKDRRPFVGLHKNHPELAVLNGLGTRGVLVAPTMAKQLFAHIDKGTALDVESDIKRFNKV